MTRTRRISALALLWSLCIAGPAFAQGTTASLVGTVTSNGVAVPGVEVTIRSTALQATRVTITGDGGTYAFPSLPPGMYVITFSANGETTTLHKTLSLASTAQGDVELRAPGVTESITVEAGAPTPLDTTDVVRNFSWDRIELLPRRRNLTDTVALAAGVNQNGPNNGIMISGGMSYDNLFLIDGIVVNENIRGQPHNAFIEDAIQELAVLTGAISAEYGRFTGGVVSAITKSGGNTWQGSLRDTFTNASWIAETPLETIAHDDETINVYEATLGGYVMKDRVWFFGAARRLRGSPANGFNATFSTRVSANPENVNPGVTTFRNTIDENRYEGKITAQLKQRHSFVLSHLQVDAVEHNNFLTPFIYDADSITVSRGIPVSTSAIGYSGMLTNALLLEAQFSKKNFAFSGSGSSYTDLIHGTVVTDFGGNWNAPSHCGVCTDETRDNDSLTLKSTWLLDTRRGTHAIAAGAENFREATVNNVFDTGSGYTIVNTGDALMRNGVIYPRFTDGTAIMYRPVELLSPGTDIVTRSAFVNDKWNYKRASFNLGLRYDRNHAVDSNGHLVSDDSAFSPRLGFLCDLKGDGSLVVNSSYSHYVTKITDTRNIGDVAASAGRSSLFTYQYVYDPPRQGLPGNFPIAPQINPAGSPPVYDTRQALQLLFNWFNALTPEQRRLILTQATIPGYGVSIPDPVGSTYVREVLVGVGTRLGSRTFARVDFITRNWQNFIVRKLDQTTGRYTAPNDVRVLNPGPVIGDLTVLANDDGFISREYRAAQVQIGWNRGKFSGGGGYTYSTLRGNDLPETDGNGPLLNSFGHFYPEYLNYPNRLPYGYLDGDQTHRARIWGGYDLQIRKVSLNASVIQSYDSGRAYSAVGLINPYGNSRINFANSPYTREISTKSPYTRSALVPFYNYFFSDRGEFRTDATTATDLALNLSVPIRNVQLFAQGQVLNVFNGQAVNNIYNGNINTRLTTRVTAGTGESSLVAFNPFTEIPVEGKHYVLDPDFGEPTGRDAYQQPRTYRFAVGVRF
jgi:hypothetical protein